MNLSPDPQLATSSPMDYEEKYNALLLKETKTNNDNVYLKSRFEELKESHQDLISQLEKHKIIKAHEWFETGDISDSLTLIAGVGLNKINATIPKEVIEENEMLKSHHTWWLKEGGMEKYEYLKEENATLKEVQEMNQKIREEYEKEMRDIKIAMGCEGPLSWDITDILNWIEMKEEQLEATHNCSQQANADYERLVDKNNNDNLNFGDILSERDAEIAKLEEEVANNKRFTDNAVTTLLHKGWTKGDCGVWCEPKSQPRDEEDNDGYRKEVAKLKEEIEELKEEAVENKKLFDITFSEVMKHKEEATTWENIARGKSSALKKHLPDYNPKFWAGSDEDNIDYCFKKINDEIAKLKEENKMVKIQRDGGREKAKRLEFAIKKLEEEISNLKSGRHNLMCVINHLKIDYKKVLKEIEADCSPDAWDSM